MTTVANVAVAAAFLSRQQVRPEHVAHARGQQRQRGEPDDRRPKHRSKPRRPKRRQQVLPPDRRANQYVATTTTSASDEADSTSRLLHLRHTSARLASRRNHAKQAERQKRDERGRVHQDGQLQIESPAREPTIYQAPRATTAGPVAYGCLRPVGTGKMPPFRPRNPVPLAAPLLETRLNGLAPQRQGKVRDIFDLGDTLLMVATDRISAFDYVLGSGIPDKGKVLTQLSAFWFERTTRHRAEPSADRPTCRHYPDGRCGRHAEVLARPLDARAQDDTRCRSSAWRADICRGRAGRNTRPPGRSAASRCRPACASRIACPTPIFTPATKADSGHDINISERRPAGSSAPTRCARLRDLTLALYDHGAQHAESRGIILADTKFEFGLTDAGDDPADRRGDDAGFVALLAEGQYAPGRAATELRQAVRARLPRADPLEQAAAGAVAARATWCRARATSTSRRFAGSPARLLTCVAWRPAAWC